MNTSKNEPDNPHNNKDSRSDANNQRFCIDSERSLDALAPFSPEARKSIAVIYEIIVGNSESTQQTEVERLKSALTVAAIADLSRNSDSHKVRSRNFEEKQLREIIEFPDNASSQICTEIVSSLPSQKDITKDAEEIFAFILKGSTESAREWAVDLVRHAEASSKILPRIALTLQHPDAAVRQAGILLIRNIVCGLKALIPRMAERHALERKSNLDAGFLHATQVCHSASVAVVPALLATLKSDDSTPVSICAALSLGEIVQYSNRQRGVFGFIRFRMCKDFDHWSQNVSAQLFDEAKNVESAIQQKLLSCKHPERAMLLFTLAGIAGGYSAETEKLLVEEFARVKADPAAEVILLESLRQYGCLSKLWQEPGRYLHQEDPNVKRFAAFAIYQVPEWEVSSGDAEIVSQYLTSSYPEERLKCVVFLGKLGEKSASLLTKLDLLAEKDADSAVRKQSEIAAAKIRWALDPDSTPFPDLSDDLSSTWFNYPPNEIASEVHMNNINTILPGSWWREINGEFHHPGESTRNSHIRGEIEHDREYSVQNDSGYSNLYLDNSYAYRYMAVDQAIVECGWTPEEIKETSLKRAEEMEEDQRLAWFQDLDKKLAAIYQKLRSWGFSHADLTR